MTRASVFLSATVLSCAVLAGCASSSTPPPAAGGAGAAARPAANPPKDAAADNPAPRRNEGERAAARSTPAAAPAAAPPAAGRLSDAEVETLSELDGLLRRWNAAHDGAAEDERHQLEASIRERVQKLRPQLTAYLGGPHVEARVVAAAALGFSGDSECIPALLQALNDSNYAVRAHAAFSLGLIGNKETPLEPLVRTLEDPNPDARGSAAFALHLLVKPGQGRNLVPPLVARLEDPAFNVRNEAVRALAVIASPDAVPAILRTTLHDDYFLVRLNSAIALAQTKDPRSIDPLIATLAEREPQFRKGALYALEQITGEHLGDDPEPWRAWWAQNKDKFGDTRLPDRVPAPQPEAPKANAPVPGPAAPGPAAGKPPAAGRGIEEESSDVREQHR